MQQEHQHHDHDLQQLLRFSCAIFGRAFLELGSGLLFLFSLGSLQRFSQQVKCCVFGLFVLSRFAVVKPVFWCWFCRCMCLAGRPKGTHHHHHHNDNDNDNNNNNNNNNKCISSMLIPPTHPRKRFVLHCWNLAVEPLTASLPPSVGGF